MPRSWLTPLRGVRPRRRPADRGTAFERQVVWMLGSPRSGTTWLINLLAAQPGHMKIDEPGIGVHLGLFLHEFYGSPARNFPPGRALMTDIRASDPDYVFADRYADSWRPNLRRLVCERFAAQAAAAGLSDAICLVKEPNGSQVAGLLVDLLPASRLMWVLRDGRDVVDSELDALSPGGWTSEHGATWEMTTAERLRFVEDRAHRWVHRTQAVQNAFDRLQEGRRLLVRYEDLRANPATHLRTIHDWLGRPVAAADISSIADRLSFENVPVERRGPGKFVRSATAGGWRQNLTPDEQDVLARVMGKTLNEHGYR